MKNKLFLFIIGISSLMISCDKYLEDTPSKTNNIEIKTIEHVNGLLADFAYLSKDSNSAIIYGSDDVEIPIDLYKSTPQSFYYNDLLWYLWDIENNKLKNTDYFFSKSYQKIFAANTVLNSIDKVSGSDIEKNNLKSEAHFLRAYQNWLLVNTYCLPYADKFLSELGLPKKTTIDYKQSMKRMSLKETYNFIEEDLKEALNSKDTDIKRIWRGNIYAIKGFMARFYLFKGDYNEALKYANEVLAVKSDLIDYNTEMHYGRDLNYNYKGENKTIKMPYTHDEQSDFIDILGWKEFIYIRLLTNGSWWYIPSKSLLNLYDKAHDLRYKYHMIEEYSHTRAKTDISYPGYIFFYKDKVPAGITTANLYLIKAECLARMGNYSKAMETVNILRAKRMTPGSHVNLTASSKDEAILKILKERRREMPFSMRWFDIRRLNYNETPIDDVVLKRKFYEYTETSILSNKPLKEYSLSERRYANPFTTNQVVLSKGVLENNKY